jgi:SlyX protein
MSDRDIEELEVRIAHQEAAIDELTRQALLQQRQIDELIGHVQKLQQQLRELAEGRDPVVDAPPPHY